MNKQKFIIKLLRDRLKAPQEGLAQLLGVSVMTINRWEKGKSEPGGWYASLMSRLLCCPPPKTRLSVLLAEQGPIQTLEMMLRSIPDGKDCK